MRSRYQIFFVIVQAYIPTAMGNTVHQWKFWFLILSVGVNKVFSKFTIPFTETYADIDKIPSLEMPIPGLVMLDYFTPHNVNEAKWWHGSRIRFRRLTGGTFERHFVQTWSGTGEHDIAVLHVDSIWPIASLVGGQSFKFLHYPKFEMTGQTIGNLNRCLILKSKLFVLYVYGSA